MTSETSGCLHDYQLTSSDMKNLENSDLLIINGGGMEGFIDDISAAYPDLKIVDSSIGIELIEGSTCTHDHAEESTDVHAHEDENESVEEHTLEHEDEASGEHTLEHEDESLDEHNRELEDESLDEHTHDNCSHNSHMWLNTTLYCEQINNVYNGLLEQYPEYKKELSSNLAIYLAKVNNIASELDSLEFPEHTEIIIFHDAFAYMANDLNLHVSQCINIDGDTSLSAGEIADCINHIKEHNIQLLFTEAQFDSTIADRIAEETGAKVIVIDTLVSGDNSKDSYINGMKKNLQTLREALQ